MTNKKLKHIKIERPPDKVIIILLPIQPFPSLEIQKTSFRQGQRLQHRLQQILERPRHESQKRQAKPKRPPGQTLLKESRFRSHQNPVHKRRERKQLHQEKR